MKQTDCPIGSATQIIGDHWNIQIVRQLLEGCKRFNELEENIDNVTTATLSARLKLLVNEGLIERKQYECIPLKVEYSLTAKGEDLSALVKDIETFAYKYYSK